MRRKLIIVSILSSVLLVGCGIKGNLKTPPPIWGKQKVEPPKKVDTPKADQPDAPKVDQPTTP